MNCVFYFVGWIINQRLKLLGHVSVLIFTIAFVYKLHCHENNFRTTYCPPLSLTMGILVGMWVVCFYFVGLMKKQGLKLMCHDTRLMFFNQFFCLTISIPGKLFLVPICWANIICHSQIGRWVIWLFFFPWLIVKNWSKYDVFTYFNPIFACLCRSSSNTFLTWMDSIVSVSWR